MAVLFASTFILLLPRAAEATRGRANRVVRAAESLPPPTVAEGPAEPVRDAGSAAAAQAPAPSAAPTATSTCPQPEAVWAEFGTLVPSERFAQYLKPLAGGPMRAAAARPLEIVDLGSRYRVIAAGRVREYRDDRRDCADRARVAALFVALALDPANASFGTEAPPDPAPAPAPPPAPLPSVGAREPRDSRLDLGASMNLGSRDGQRIIQFGGGLRLALGRGPFAIVIGVLVPLPVDTEVGGIRIREWRIPVDLGLRVRVADRLLEPYAELGLTAAVVSARGLDLATSASARAIELGPYATAALRLFAGSRVAPFVALRAEWIPEPLAVKAAPSGVVGHDPRLWVGLTAGASVGF